jgi:glyoxylase-like metal-dependent hydrolase (beta-lactamase superfamily II)
MVVLMVRYHTDIDRVIIMHGHPDHYGAAKKTG